MKLPIGGFFELEMQGGNFDYHSGAYAFLTSGRASLNLILKKKKPKRLYLPCYSCNSILDAIIRNNIEPKYYHINQKFEVDGDLALKEDEAILLINYFGLKTKYIEKISSNWESVIIDNTQAFYIKNEERISFNSSRKFFGVPDGSYVYLPEYVDEKEAFPDNPTINYKHLFQRLNGQQELAFENYKSAEKMISSELYAGSIFSQSVLKSLDYESIMKKRQDNFNFLNNFLKKYNIIKLSLNDSDVPFCYPFMLEKGGNYRRKLLDKKIFFPILWPEVLDNNESSIFEKKIALNMFPLSIDQRYGNSEMKYIVETVLEVIDA